jgi:hypothetical protein
MSIKKITQVMFGKKSVISASLMSMCLLPLFCNARPKKMPCLINSPFVECMIETKTYTTVVCMLLVAVYLVRLSKKTQQ